MNRLSPYIQAKLCEVILTLLEEEAFLSNFNQYLIFLNTYRHEIPRDILNELQEILRDHIEFDEGVQMMPRPVSFSDEGRERLIEQLLELYIEIKGGSLIV